MGLASKNSDTQWNVQEFNDADSLYVYLKHVASSTYIGACGSGSNAAGSYYSLHGYEDRAPACTAHTECRTSWQVEFVSRTTTTTTAPTTTPATTTPSPTTPAPTTASPTAAPTAAPDDNFHRKVDGVGAWGGICTCPDGRFYEVGDNMDHCASLACEGGTSGPCSEGGVSEENKGMMVTCAPAPAAEAPGPTPAPVTEAEEGIQCSPKITKDAKPGDTSLEVSLQSCFFVGQELVIAKDTAYEENIVVVGLGSLLLRDPLTFAHSAGTFLTIDGSNAPLNAGGFKAVSSLCCPPEMEIFFSRLLNSLGLDVCSKPHVQGLMHWFTCVPDMDYQYFLDVIANGNPCKYWATTGSACPALSAECEGEWCR